jgi:hypothetical protein
MLQRQLSHLSGRKLHHRQGMSHFRDYNISAQTTSKTLFPRIAGMFTSPLPRDGRPVLLVANLLERVY